jgi:Acyl-CoA dehydrogenase, N-terminal domain
MIKDMVARFSADVIKPRVRAMDDAGCMDPAVITGLFENGLMGVEVPAEQGGSGLGFTSACLVIEEIAKVDPSVAVMVDIQVRSTEHVCAVTALEAVTLHLHCIALLCISRAHVYCCCCCCCYDCTHGCKQNTLLNNMLRFYGTPELQSKYFAQMTSSKVASFALSEPGSGSDAFALTTTATLSADKSYYTIEGDTHSFHCVHSHSCSKGSLELLKCCGATACNRQLSEVLASSLLPPSLLLTSACLTCIFQNNRAKDVDKQCRASRDLLCICYCRQSCRLQRYHMLHCRQRGEHHACMHIAYSCTVNLNMLLCLKQQNDAQHDDNFVITKPCITL